MLKSLVLSLLCALPAFADIPEDEYFRVETLASSLRDAMEMELLPNGNVIIVERTGQIRIWDKKTSKLNDYDTIEVIQAIPGKFARESGLLGIAIDPNFSQNQHIYLFYSPPEPSEHRVSRFKMTLDGLTEEKVLLNIPSAREDRVCHEGGSLEFGPDGLLYISVGDNTCPFESNGYAPIDEMDGRKNFDAQRSAGNSNDLRGAILRIRPTADGGYTIPKGNLFPKGMKNTRPEIYAMGCRNPWRISLDPTNSTLYWGEVGPDAAKDSERGPRGYCEINQTTKAGYFGWPYFIGENIAYADYDFSRKKTGRKFSKKSVKNNSPNNTGLKKLPKPRKAFITHPRSCWCAGPVVRDMKQSTPQGLPDSFDNHLISYDWNNGRILLTQLGKKDRVVSSKPWLISKKIIHPSDMILGPDRSLYILEYGSNWDNNTDGRLLKVTYSETPLKNEAPQVDPRIAGLPLDHPGTQILSTSICLSCHQTETKSVGPSYKDVALKYSDRADATDYLIDKIKKGGQGVWGQIPMPPQIQYNDEQLSQIVDVIIGLARIAPNRMTPKKRENESS